MAAIAAKVFILAVKTIAKPVSNRFQDYVMNHPIARQRAIKMAQAVHRFEVLITRGAEGRTSKAFIADMTEDKSIELASKLVSEGFVFAVGTALVLLEYQRQSVKDAKKREAERRERMAIQINAERERQRLADENRHQQELIQSLLLRVDKLENAIQATLQQETQKMRAKRGWGGFFGPRGLTEPQSNVQTAGS